MTPEPSVDVLAAQVRGAFIRERLYAEVERAEEALAVLVGYAKRAERMEIKPDPTPRLPELEIEDGYGI